MFKIDNKVLTKGIKNFQEILQISNHDNKRLSEAKSIHADDFVERFCDNFNNINENDIIIIKGITINSLKLNISTENTPPSIAAGSIFLYCKIKNIDIDKKALSKVSQISEVTINKCYKILEPYSKELIQV